MSNMDSVDDIFEYFGGPAKVARHLGVGPSTASEMRRRQSIPVEHWDMLLVADQQLDNRLNAGVLAKVMAEAARLRRQQRASQQASE